MNAWILVVWHSTKATNLNPKIYDKEWWYVIYVCIYVVHTSTSVVTIGPHAHIPH